MAKCSTMAEYMNQVWELMQHFKNVELKQLLKKENSHAYALANIATTLHLVGKRTIPVEFISDRRISKDLEVMTIIEEGRHGCMKL